MKVLLVVIGKTNEKYFIDGINEYVSRIQHYLNFEVKVIPELKNTKHLTEDIQKTKEGELILKTLLPGDHVVLLDEKGKEMKSIEFAEYLSNKLSTLAKRLVFIIGGPYGFADSIYTAANDKISLSKMTFSHQMVRMIFVEQLYRAMTILAGTPYHHE